MATSPKTTLAAVNKRLADLGVAERLVRGKDYFYFSEAQAHTWDSAGVYGTGPISATTVESWLREYENLSGTTLPLRDNALLNETAPMATETLAAKLKPDNFLGLAITLSDRKKQEFASLLATFAKGLEEGRIANPIYQDAKTSLGRMVDEGYKAHVSARFMHAGKWESLPEDVRELDQSFMITGLHDCKSALKKVRAKTLNHAMYDVMLRYLTEIEPLVLANEALKPLIVKRMPKTEAQKEAEHVFVPPPGSTEATKRVQAMLVEVTTSERENIVKWLSKRYEKMAHRYFHGMENEPITAEIQRKLFSDPEYREVALLCNATDRLAFDKIMVSKRDYSADLLGLAEKHAKQLQDRFVFKNLTKLAAILEAKGDFDRGEVIGHRVDLAGLTGSMRFHFKDGAHFEVENSVVYSTSVHGNPFMRFPLTFHDVYHANGERMKSPSEERMHTHFVKGPEVAAEKPSVPSIEYVGTWRGEEGNDSHITAKELLTIPPQWLEGIKGLKGEVRNWTATMGFGNYSAAQWDGFLADIGKNGVREAITVFVDPEHGMRLCEGNHRLAAAQQLGLTLVPVEVRYFGHAEKDAGLFSDRIERETGQLRATALAAVPASDPLRKEVTASTWSRSDTYSIAKLGSKEDLESLLIEARAKAEEAGMLDQFQSLIDNPLSSPVVVLEKGGNITVLSDKLQVAAALHAGIDKVPALVGIPTPAPANEMQAPPQNKRDDNAPAI